MISVKHTPAARPLRAADLYAGAGGSGLGLDLACSDFEISYELTAVNHDPNAISSHEANLPLARHRQMDVDRLKRRDLSSSGALDILWASPACTDHSFAKGGASLDFKSRMSAWAVVRETERYEPSIVIVENVLAFNQWGPVMCVSNHDGSPKMGKDGLQLVRPNPARRSSTYNAWFSAMESIGRGYTGQQLAYDAAGFGAPQTRERSYTVFTAPGVVYEPPTYTHGPLDSADVRAGALLPYNTARSIIQLGRPSRSIFDPAFGPQGNRFLSPGTLSRVAAGVAKFGSADASEAFIVVLRRHADARGLDGLLPTVLAGGTHIALVEPQLVPLEDFAGAESWDNAPADTATELSLVVAAFLIKVNRGLTRREIAADRVSSLDVPLDTVTTKNGLALAEVTLAPAGSTSGLRVVEIKGRRYIFDVRFRMVGLDELAAAQGFSPGYVFTGGRGSQTAQIGNAVEVRTARALYRQALLALGYARPAALAA